MAKVDVVNIMIWNELKSYLPRGTILSSVYRPDEHQLKIIVDLATKEKFKFTKPPTLGDRSSWAPALAFLRSKGYEIAEPGKSSHRLGIAYDLKGPDLSKIEAGVRRAVKDGRIMLAQTPKPIRHELVNKCVHVEIVGATLLSEQFDYVRTV
jgi:hypothetical protein